MRLIEKDFLKFYKFAHWNYGVVMTPFSIGLGMIPGHFMSVFFVFITLSMILISHYYKVLLNTKYYIKIEFVISFITVFGMVTFLFFKNIMIYAVFIKLFDIFKEYLIRIEGIMFSNSIDIIVKKDYSKLYILFGLLISTIIFWTYPQEDAIFYSVLVLIMGEMFLIYYKIRIYIKLKKGNKC